MATSLPCRLERIALCLCVCSLTVLAGCGHEWDLWLPVGGGPAGGGTSAGGGGTGASTSTGGTGGVVVTGSCPEGSGGNETPIVLVPTPADTAMCIDQHEVTRGQYESWVNGSPTPDQLPVCTSNASYLPVSDWPPNGVGLTRPVAFIDWCDAYAFCADHNKRLCGHIVGGGSLPFGSFTNPNVGEWFNACTDRGNRQFPYGSSYDAAACNGGASGTVAVGEETGCENAYGVQDLSGNVAEWENSCADEGSASSECRIRGGGFNNTDTQLACAADSTRARDQPSIAIGFRCCADPIP